jgi:membrane protein DedA with SNARE-associated domain
MFESMLLWLGGLPPVAIYGVIALLAAVENVFPPFPADTGIALGAFLSHRGLTDPWLVFGVTLVANVGGAMGMYWLAARHAPALFRSRIARRYLTDDGMAFVRREYERFGMAGLFVGRMLPGFRAVVAPFAGLIHLGPLRAGVPMLLASALWYGGIVFLAAQLGSHVDRVVALVADVNRLLAVLAALVLVGLGAWLWRRRGSRAP